MKFLRIATLFCALCFGCDTQPKTVMPGPDEIDPMPTNVVPMSVPQAPDIERLSDEKRLPGSP